MKLPQKQQRKRLKANKNSCLERTKRENESINSGLKAIQIISLRKTFCRQSIPESKCTRRLTVFLFLIRLGLLSSSTAKTVSKKIEALIEVSFSKEIFYIYKFTIQPCMEYCMSGRVLLDAAWICQVSHTNRYVELLVQYLVPFLNPQVIVEMQPV